MWPNDRHRASVSVLPQAPRRPPEPGAATWTVWLTAPSITPPRAASPAAARTTRTGPSSSTSWPPAWSSSSPCCRPSASGAPVRILSEAADHWRQVLHRQLSVSVINIMFGRLLHDHVRNILENLGSSLSNCIFLRIYMLVLYGQPMSVRTALKHFDKNANKHAIII